MDIKVLQDRKNKLERDITTLIRDFQNETNWESMDININFLDVSTFADAPANGSRFYPITQIKLEI